MSRVDLIPGPSLFSDLRADTLHRLESLGTILHEPANQELFTQYEPGDALYMVKKGAVEISVMGISGKKLTLNYMGEGDLFGEIALLDGGPRTATAITVDGCQLLRITRADVLALIKAEPEIAIELIDVLCQRIRWISSQLEDRSLLPIEARLARRLLILDEKRGDSGGIVHISQSDLADFVGATRESINKVLVQWQKEDWIDMTRGSITVKDNEALNHIIENADEAPRT